MHGGYYESDLVGFGSLTVPSSLNFTSNATNTVSKPTIQSIFSSISMLSAMFYPDAEPIPFIPIDTSNQTFGYDFVCSKPVLDACVKSYFQS